MAFGVEGILMYYGRMGRITAMFGCTKRRLERKPVFYGINIDLRLGPWHSMLILLLPSRQNFRARFSLAQASIIDWCHMLIILLEVGGNFSGRLRDGGHMAYIPAFTHSIPGAPPVLLSSGSACI